METQRIHIFTSLSTPTGLQVLSRAPGRRPTPQLTPCYTTDKFISGPRSGTGRWRTMASGADWWKGLSVKCTPGGRRRNVPWRWHLLEPLGRKEMNGKEQWMRTRFALLLTSWMSSRLLNRTIDYLFVSVTTWQPLAHTYLADFVSMVACSVPGAYWVLIKYLLIEQMRERRKQFVRRDPVFT